MKKKPPNFLLLDGLKRAKMLLFNNLYFNQNYSDEVRKMPNIGFPKYLLVPLNTYLSFLMVGYTKRQ